MIWMLFADAAAEVTPWAPALAVTSLAGVVVWLAKAYRDDMKERAAASMASHEKVAAEFKQASEETRDKFLTTIDKQREALDDLCDSVRSLHCNARMQASPTTDPRLHARTN